MFLLLKELELGGGLFLQMSGELSHAADILIPCLFIGWNAVAKAESEVFSAVSMYFISNFELQASLVMVCSDSRLLQMSFFQKNTDKLS